MEDYRPPFRVVPFRAEHQDEVRAVAEEILCREYGVQGDLTGEDDLQDIAASYAEPGGRFLVAVMGDEIAGTGGIQRISDEDCELRRLYVLSAFRRQGIASALMAHLIEFVKERGYKRVLLHLGHEMDNTVGGYKRYGFQPDTENLPRPGSYLSIRLA